MKSKKMFDNFFTILVLFTTIVNSHEDRRVVKDISGGFGNEMFDSIIAKIKRDDISLKKFREVHIPKLEEELRVNLMVIKFGATLTATDGVLGGITSLRRISDVITLRDGEFTHYSAVVAMDDLNVAYNHYTLRLGLFHNTGDGLTVHMGTNSFIVTLTSRVNDLDCQLAVEELSVLEMRDMQVELSGFSIFNVISRHVVTWFEDYFYDLIGTTIDNYGKEMVNYMIKESGLCEVLLFENKLITSAYAAKGSTTSGALVSNSETVAKKPVPQPHIHVREKVADPSIKVTVSPNTSPVSSHNISTLRPKVSTANPQPHVHTSKKVDYSSIQVKVSPNTFPVSSHNISTLRPKVSTGNPQHHGNTSEKVANPSIKTSVSPNTSQLSSQSVSTLRPKVSTGNPQPHVHTSKKVAYSSIQVTVSPNTSPVSSHNMSTLRPKVSTGNPQPHVHTSEKVANPSIKTSVSPNTSQLSSQSVSTLRPKVSTGNPQHHGNISEKGANPSIQVKVSPSTSPVSSHDISTLRPASPLPKDNPQPHVHLKEKEADTAIPEAGLQSTSQDHGRNSADVSQSTTVDIFNFMGEIPSVHDLYNISDY